MQLIFVYMIQHFAEANRVVTYFFITRTSLIKAEILSAIIICLILLKVAITYTFGCKSV